MAQESESGRETATISRFGPWRREFGAFLQLVALAGIAIVQPTLDIMGKNAGTLVPVAATTGDLVVFTALVVFVPGLAAWAIEVVIGLAAPRLRPFAHAGIAGVLATIIAFEVLKDQTGVRTRYLIVAGLLLGLLAAVLILRWSIVRDFLQFLAVAPVGFGVLFMLSSPVGALRNADPPTAGAIDVRHPHRVVMVVMDELPVNSLLDGEGAVDATMFPNLAALSSDSTWYRNDTTVADYTLRSVPAIDSGFIPKKSNAMAISGEYPKSLFTLLGGSYRMNVHEGGEALCPPRACPRSSWRSLSDAQGVRGLVDDAWPIWTDFASPVRTSAPSLYGTLKRNALRNAEDFVHSLQPDRKPTFDYLHFLLPHQPWHYYADGRSVGEGPHSQYGKWTTGASAVLGKQRHLLQTQTADWLIGQTVRRLKAIGAYDDALIVVTADHGVAFNEGVPSRSVTKRNFDQIMWTPLFVKSPGQAAGKVDDQPVESIDIVPTIADHLGVRIPWKVDGRSLLEPRRTDGPRVLVKGAWDKVVNPKEGNPTHFDGPTGFAKVRAWQAWPQFADPVRRLYSLGRYGNLLGRDIAPLVDHAAPVFPGAIARPQLFRAVQPGARSTPWAFIEGALVTGVGQEQIVVAVNGRVAGFSLTHPAPRLHRAGYTASLDPGMFHKGSNDVTAYVVDGPPSSPRLVPIRARSRTGT